MPYPRFAFAETIVKFQLYLHLVILPPVAYGFKNCHHNYKHRNEFRHLHGMELPSLERYTGLEPVVLSLARTRNTVIPVPRFRNRFSIYHTALTLYCTPLNSPSKL